jgi:hypothetical protein
MPKLQVILHGWNDVAETLFEDWPCVPRRGDTVMGDRCLYRVAHVVWNPGMVPVVHVWLVQ